MYLISRYRLSLVATILVLLFFSCSSVGDGTGEGDRVLRPTAGWASSASSSSADGGDSNGDSASGGSSSGGDNFKAGDIVWAWADRYGTNDGYIKAWKLTATGVNGELESPYRKLWPADFSDLSIQALHGDFNDGIQEGMTPLSALAHTVSTNQTSPDSRNHSDLLYAVLSPANYKSRLTFYHMLSKVRIILNDTECLGGMTAESLANADIRLRQVATTVKLDVPTRQAVSCAPYSDILLGTTTDTDYTVEAIIPPQVVDSGKTFLELTLHNFPRKNSVRTFSFVAPSGGIIFDSGKEYVYTISVKNLISAKPADVGSWENPDGDIEQTLVWTNIFFNVMVMEWNGLTEYDHQWAFISLLPTTEEWDGEEYVHKWGWLSFSPDVDAWMQDDLPHSLIIQKNK